MQRQLLEIEQEVIHQVEVDFHLAEEAEVHAAEEEAADSTTPDTNNQSNQIHIKSKKR